MDENTNQLVVRKKHYEYIFLIIIFILSIIGSIIYFSKIADSKNVELVSKENQISGENQIQYENSMDEFIDTSGEKIAVEDDQSGDINCSKLAVEDIKEEDFNNSYYENIRELDASKPMVALTFDDGPDPKRTLKMIEILKKNNVRATFFDIGNLMEKYPDVVKQEVEAGCDVGGHTYSHVNLNALSQEEAKKEIMNVEDAFENATGHKLKYLRPTYGNANSKVREVTDIPIINWCVDSLDWQSRNADKVIEEIRKTKNLDGKIILMHVIYDSTLKAMEKLIPELIEEGYQIVTISEMAKYKGFELEAGKVYYNFVKTST